MNIQSSLNSMLGTIHHAVGLKNIVGASKESSKYFGSMAKTKQERQSSILDMKKMKERQSMKPADRVAEGQQRIVEHDYFESGQAEADAMTEAMYNEQQVTSIGETKEVVATAERITNIQNTKEGLAQRKEYLRKPRVLNKHGVLYQEVMKDGK